jgi:sulfite exporter TauE/SafE
VSSVYHLSRLAGYAVLGALAGGLGRLRSTGSAAMSCAGCRGSWCCSSSPWPSAGIASSASPPRSAAHLRLKRWAGGRSRIQAAAALGFATPLLPCGPLYFIVALALLSGSALRGVEYMLAFGLGTVPLLWLAQSQFHWVRQSSPRSGSTAPA